MEGSLRERGRSAGSSSQCGGRRKTPSIWVSRDFCLRCGLCCRETEMILAPSDIERLESLGFKREDFAVFDGQLYRLRNVDGYCFFYDKETGRCRVYPYRPVGCSAYPIVFDVETQEYIVDTECPLASTTSEEEIGKARDILGELLRELGLTDE